MVTIKKAKQVEKENFNWQETFSGLGASFFKNFADSLADKIKSRIQEMLVALQKGILGIFLILTGTILALISLVFFINEMLNLGTGFGYALVGTLSILMGLLIIKSK